MTKDEVFEGVTGIYLKGSRGGQVNTGEGVFQFNAVMGYRIKDGKIGEAIRDVSLSGNTLKTLNSILRVGNDLKFNSGRCGKAGQGVPVGDGSPHILVKDAVVGGHVMIDRAKKLVDLALKLGASEAEVYASSGKIVNVETVRGDLGYAEESISEGLGVRVIVGGAEGYSSSNDPARFEAAVKAAIECARARPADPDLKGLPGPKPYRNVRGVFDERVAGHEARPVHGHRGGDDRGGERGKGRLRHLRQIPDGRLGRRHPELQGISVEDRETVVMGYADVIIKEGDRVSTAFDYDVSRSADIDMKAVGHNAASSPAARCSRSPSSSRPATCCSAPTPSGTSWNRRSCRRSTRRASRKAGPAWPARSASASARTG